MKVPGTTGYAEVTARFIEATRAIDFAHLHAPFLDLIPTAPTRALDLGAGIGRDAAALAEMGHEVVAVEPLTEFLRAARSLYPDPRITWLKNALPELSLLGSEATFGFVLSSGVWHHLDPDEQRRAMARIAALMAPGAVFAVSLRHGPAGAGSHVFPTDGVTTAELASVHGLRAVVHLPHQPSLMPGKEAVSWTRMAFVKG